MFPNPITTWNEINIPPSGPPPPGYESLGSDFTPGASLDTVLVTLNAVTPTGISPQFINAGGSLDATLTFSGENYLVECNPDANGNCNNGPLEPDFGVVGDATGTLDVNYTLPGELPEPGYLVLMFLLAMPMAGMAARRYYASFRRGGSVRGADGN